MSGGLRGNAVSPLTCQPTMPLIICNKHYILGFTVGMEPRPAKTLLMLCYIVVISFIFLDGT